MWFSEKSTFVAFKSKEEFLKALNETRYQYPKTHHDNAHWLKVVKNYKENTGSSLVIK
jgi:predicted DNA-binding protein (MmcQ/YjbR family)